VRRHRRVVGEDLGQGDPVVDGVDEQVQRELLLEPCGQQEVDELARRREVLRAAQHAGELDLAEAGRVDARGCRLVDLGVGEDDLGGRAAGVADDDRLVALAAGGERGVVGVVPRVDDVDAVGPEPLPVVDPPVLAVLHDRRQHERQPR
jgi:hypothetical protein